MLLQTETRWPRIKVDDGKAILVLSFRVGKKLLLAPEVVISDLWVIVDHK